MELIVKNIPREYLALKIDYCKLQLKQLPDVRLHAHKAKGVVTQKVVIGNHRYNPDSVSGKKSLKVKETKEYYRRQLSLFESLWKNKSYGDFPSECVAHRVKRKVYVDTTTSVVMNKEFFDSLKNDANPKHNESRNYPFNGIYYRSASERDIAMYYTEMGIPFKYEPEIFLKDMAKPIYPDFVIYIKELDNCKFHEHFGINQSATYQRVTGIKYNNYTNAGLIPEIDVLFTHDTDDMPFDIRTFVSKLNTAVYTTALSAT